MRRNGELKSPRIPVLGREKIEMCDKTTRTVQESEIAIL